MTSHPFIAIFCPNCGHCVNEPTDRPEYEEPPFMNCGWCRQRHGLEGVLVCRNLKFMTEAQFVAGGMRAMRRALLEQRRNLTMTLMPGEFVTLPPFNVEEVEELLLALQEREQQLAIYPTASDSHHLVIVGSLQTALREGLGSHRRLEPDQNPD